MDKTNPGTKLNRAERRHLRRAERAVDRMSPMQQAIFLSICVDDLSCRELAAKHGLSTAEVEHHLAGALRILSQTMDRSNRKWWQFWRRW